VQLRLARDGKEEEENEDGEVEHVDRELLWVTWKPQDFESGVQVRYSTGVFTVFIYLF
jgi:hypothetical protein